MKIRFLVFIFIWTHLSAVQIPGHQVYPPQLKVSPPWFTGPLLAPSAITVPPGHFNFEPYFYANAEVGKYDNNWHAQKIETFRNNSLQLLTQVGITRKLDCVFSPVVEYNYVDGAANWALGDLPFGFDFQIYKHNKILTDWGTAVSFRIQEIFPIGKYQNLNPAKKLSDAGGEGSWQTELSLIWGNLFYLGNIYFVTWRTAFQYVIPSPVGVKNLNVYGGGPGTSGTVYPGQSCIIDTAIEITLSQNWAFACDFVGSWKRKTKFSGHTILPNTSPSSVEYSIAPALEYNWRSNLGAIFGCWFTVAGKNTAQFINGIAAIDYYY